MVNIKKKNLMDGLLKKSNYLRAEILYRLDLNPFQKISNLTTEKKEELLQLCHDIPALAYAAGGGEFYTFKNPNTANRESGIGSLIQIYGRKDNPEVMFLDDKSKRRFWFHPKWENEAKEYLKK